MDQLSYVTDNVAAIRESSVDVFRKLIVVFGDDFVEDTFFPVISDLLHHEKYFLRITALHIIAVSFVGEHQRKSAGMEIDAEKINSRVLELLVDIQNDAIANVRLNLAQTFLALKEKWEDNRREKIILPILQTLEKDVDEDVQYYAHVAMDGLEMVCDCLLNIF